MIRKNNFDNDIDQIILEALNNDHPSSSKMHKAEFDDSIIGHTPLYDNQSSIGSTINKKNERSQKKKLILSIIPITILSVIIIGIVLLINKNSKANVDSNVLVSDNDYMAVVTSTTVINENIRSDCSKNEVVETTTIDVTDKSHNVEVHINNYDQETTSSASIVDNEDFAYYNSYSVPYDNKNYNFTTHVDDYNEVYNKESIDVTTEVTTTSECISIEDTSIAENITSILNDEDCEISTSEIKDNS